jgi:16S rRNA (cytosine1402-N4)-methyltransferase
MKRPKRGGKRDVMDPSSAQEGRAADGGRVRHIPVALTQVLHALAPRAGASYIDGTFGAGGYTRALLEAAQCRVLALDRDPNAIRDGQALVEAFKPRLSLIETPFSAMKQAAEQAGFQTVDGIVLDLGVSSMQLDEPERGFSFQSDGPLDMRMSQTGLSAADVVNGYGEREIADILYKFGEERRSRAIAAAIVKARAEAPIKRTGQLADLVSRVLGRKFDDAKHPATRTFQALRLYVNDELGELTRALEAAEALLEPGGKLVVVTFHSLEDRIVKQFFIDRAGKKPSGSRHLPPKAKGTPPAFRLEDRHGLTPSADEIAANPRARSARVRWGVRLSKA